MASERITLTVPGSGSTPDREVGLSSPNRVLWPEVGITKHELAEYVIAVADAFLAHNGHRPVSLERYPEVVGGECAVRGFVEARLVETDGKRLNPLRVHTPGQKGRNGAGIHPAREENAKGHIAHKTAVDRTLQQAKQLGFQIAGFFCWRPSAKLD